MSHEPGRILALDLGDVRIGLALSDPLGITAQPAGILERVGIRKDLSRIRALMEEQSVMKVVVGYPLHLSGKVGSRADQAEDFANRLRKLLPDVPVELWDERLTTVEAERVMRSAHVRREKRRKIVDSLAAVLILSSYMDAKPCKEPLA